MRGAGPGPGPIQFSFNSILIRFNRDICDQDGCISFDEFVAQFGAAPRQSAREALGSMSSELQVRFNSISIQFQFNFNSILIPF